MVLTPTNRRIHCPVCTRPQSTCICHWVRPIAQDTDVIILQHPLEVHHAKNSAGLLHMSLQNSRILVGEVFDDAVVQAILKPAKTSVLLYPPADDAGHAKPEALNPAQLAEPSQVRLVVLDATWRKSRKMLHQNPWLQTMPRLSLDATWISGYTIRKAHKPGQLSTLEATCAALAQLQADDATYVPLLKAFQGFVAEQAAYANGPVSASNISGSISTADLP